MKKHIPVIIAALIVIVIAYLAGMHAASRGASSSSDTTDVKTVDTPTTNTPKTTTTSTPTAATKIHLSKGGPAVYYSSDAVKDLIKVNTPPLNTIITSPLTITGNARGNWFFEASAPVVLVDLNGKVLARGTILAQSDWMTTDYVPFLGTLTFTRQPSGSKGVLILKNDNPSGLSSKDMSMEILVTF